MLMVTGSKVGSRPGPFRSPRAYAAGMSPLPKERLAEKLLTSGGLRRAGIVGLLRDGRRCLLVMAASGRPSSDRRKGRR